ncbi:MAG TPA: hypothetical protein VMH81_13950 [Bryobacteraceae bacterium]|nr:hypothetical protein [Bryobacteraceae bacterium]
MSTSPVTPLSADQTTLAAAQANILANSQMMVSKLNADLIAKYNQAYADYVTNMQSGENVPADRRNPPVPPMAWELAPPDPNGFVFYEIGHTPVCAQGAAVGCNYDNPQPNTQPNVIMIGGPIPGAPKWYQALKGDTFPSGMTTPPQPDGHTYEKFGAPVGPGWYLQVS